ncbi:hypothetical protein Taro_049678 [Colocasia esculenta]|uniref:Uncharacterized protein n=1 Tax=Colocasia esculenta TaxID=4460 RepID=A0A843XBI1_COLES|nr:hypothetical protein [Colocasia esculenta]
MTSSLITCAEATTPSIHVGRRSSVPDECRSDLVQRTTTSSHITVPKRPRLANYDVLVRCECRSDLVFDLFSCCQDQLRAHGITIDKAIMRLAKFQYFNHV